MTVSQLLFANGRAKGVHSTDDRAIKEKGNILNSYKTGPYAQKMWASTPKQVIGYDLNQELKCRIKCQCSASLKKHTTP